MAWTKGQSGNPAGKPKGKHATVLARMIRAGTRDGAELVEFALSVLRGEIKDVSVRDRSDAMKWLADRGWGKTPDAATDEEGTPAVPPSLDDAALEAGLGPQGAIQ